MKVRNFERFYLKTLRCKARMVPANAVVMRSRPFLSLRKMRMRNIFDHVAESGH